MPTSTTSRPLRIVFTGGSGKAGRHVIPYLLSRGHTILNLDLQPFPETHLPPSASLTTLKTDLTDSGQVFNALTSNFSFLDYARGSPPGPPDAVIHFAAVARNLLVPDNATFAQNVGATYNVVEAAAKLGVRKIVTCSSETVYGVCFAQGARPAYASFPLCEDDYPDPSPADSYALSKVCGEKLARGFAARYGIDVYALRVGNVVEPHEYARDFPGYVEDPVATRYRNAYSYIDARDLGQICDRALAKDGLGFQVFNATNNSITVRRGGGVSSTTHFLKENHPEIRITRELDQWEAPLTNRKVREVLGFEEQHDWRKYVTLW